MLRSVFFSELTEAQNQLNKIHQELDRMASDLLSTARKLRSIDKDYNEVSKSLEVRAKSLKQFADHMIEGRNALNNVSNHLLMIERTNYKEIADIDTNFSEEFEKLIRVLVPSLFPTVIDETILKQFVDRLQDGIDSGLDFIETYYATKGIQDLDFIEKFKDLPFMKVLECKKYFDDGIDLVKALNEGDQTEVIDLLEKYTLKFGGKALEAKGIGSFTAEMYGRMSWNFGENILEEIALFGTPARSDILEQAYGLWNVTGNVAFESAMEKGWDVASDIYSVFGVDLDKTYKDLTGESGLNGFYKGVGMIVDYSVDSWSSAIGKLF